MLWVREPWRRGLAMASKEMTSSQDSAVNIVDVL